MRKRPLCLFAALLVFCLWLLPKDIWLKKPDIPSGESIQLTGIVEKREQTKDKQVYYLKNCRCSRTDSSISVLAYTTKGNSYPIGCTLSLYGTIYQLNKADNPGQFDAELYYRGQGLLYTFHSEGEQMVTRGRAFVREAAACLREFLAEKISGIYGERDAGILRAVLLADKSALRKEDKELYQRNGIAHLLAISGLHISMIGISLYRFLRKLGGSFLVSGSFSGAALLFYGLMTGFGISSVRAVTMFLVMIFAEIIGRTYDMASAMSLAALLVLAANPLQVRQAGFLLSFGSVLGICTVFPVLKKVCSVKGKTAEMMLFSVSISLVTAPLMIHFYYEYPLYSTLLNLIVIPCMPFVMGSGALGMVAGIASPLLGTALGYPAHLVLGMFESLGKALERLPFAVLTPGCEDLWQLIVYYVLLIAALLLLYYTEKKRFLSVILLSLLLVTARFRSSVEFAMLDVGQGDGLFLRLPGGTTCFIDGGSTSVKSAGEYRILPYLKHEGVRKLDYVIFSHMDADHTNGMEELLEKAEEPGGIGIGMLLFPVSADGDEKKEELCRLAKEKNIRIGSIGAGDRLEEREAVFQCLFPERGTVYQDKNEGSLVLLLEYREFQLLLTGDLGFSGEEELIRSGMLKEVDVWKVSHHGSKHSGSEQFLEQISPALSLISAGKNNRYGHPGKELLERLEASGSRVYVTAFHGALTVHSDGERFSLFLQREDD